MPPSYRRFLELHNGWARFWGAMWIAGVNGEAEEYVDGQIAEWRKYMSPPSGPDDLDFDHHLIIGADDNGGFLALDLTARADGERDVLDMPRGFVENRWASFGEFVEAQHRYRSRDAAKLAPAPPGEGGNRPPAATQGTKKASTRKAPAKKKAAKTKKAPAKKSPTKKAPAKKKGPAKKKATAKTRQTGRRVSRPK